MKKLLVPVDLSNITDEIIRQSIHFAQDLSAEIILIHVVSLDVGFILGEVGFQYLPELEETALEKDAVHLNNLKNQIEKSGVNCNSFLKQGIPAEIILETAEEIKPYAIVLGSKGHGNLYNALVGSVCHDVIKESKFPVFVVPNLD
ncbi:Universal stress protein UspE [Candidatus Ornithobacterium hominis]|uniref:universal stress protein n=1 Tax=Candidatus Ornithobacterium hominis TaxID=2497989 RepID=UPI0024BD596F|nr:universal stress protein [Candidatus Ornithobacterium hominis]CAI9429927.1 Universal stress protein UspE [Candidatus Ornithobacterium hominis]